MKLVRKVSRSYVALLLLTALVITLGGCQRFYDQQKRHYLKKGTELFDKGAYLDAIKEFENALVFDDRYADAMSMIGQCYFKLENGSLALNWLKRTEREQPKNMHIKAQILKVLIDSQKGWEALAYADKILKSDPKNIDARMVILKGYIGGNQLIEAEARINALAKEGESSATFYSLVVEYYIKKKQYAEALKTALQHFAFEKHWLRIIKPLIEKLEEDDKNEELIRLYNKIIELAPDKIPYQEKLSKRYRKIKAQDREDQFFQRLIRSNPEVMQLKINYAAFMIYYKRFSQVKAFISAQLQEHAGDISLAKSLINYYVGTQQTGAAVNVINEMLADLEPGSNRYLELQNMLASIYFDNGDFEMAASIISDILSKSRSNRDACLLRCRINMIQGDMFRVIGDLRLLIRANPDVAEYHYYLGLAHEIKDENVLAEKEFREALTISPNYREALKKWLAVYPTQGVLDEVEARVNEYLISNPADQEIVALRDAIMKQKEGILTSANKTPRQKTLSFPGLP